MELIVRGVIKMAVFGTAAAVLGKFFLNFFRRKNSQTEWFDPRIIFSAGLLSALVSSIASRIIKLFI